MPSKHSLRRPKHWLAAGLLGVAGVAGYTQLDEWQRQQIFSVEDSQRWWREAPEGTEIFDLTLPNGHHVRTWYWQHPDPSAPTVLYLHGSRWNLNGSVFRMEGWMDMGFSVLAIDYRGFGESTQLLPSERSAREDALAALEELARRQPSAERRFIFGHSLGGAIAIDLAARADDIDVAGIIVESSFTSIQDMLPTVRGGDFPGLSLFVTQHFASTRKLAAITEPLLIIHGTADHFSSIFLAIKNRQPSLPLFTRSSTAPCNRAFRPRRRYASKWRRQSSCERKIEASHSLEDRTGHRIGVLSVCLGE